MDCSLSVAVRWLYVVRRLSLDAVVLAPALPKAYSISTPFPGSPSMSAYRPDDICSEATSDAYLSLPNHSPGDINDAELDVATPGKSIPRAIHPMLLR